MSQDTRLVPGAADSPDRSSGGFWSSLAHRPKHIVWALIAALALVLSSLPIQRHHVGSFEAAVFRDVNGLPGALYWPVWGVMQLGNVLVVPVAVVVALAFRKTRLALDLALAGVGAYFLAKLVKTWVVRGRPGSLLHDVILRHAPSAGHGFVSGHAATIFAMATVLNPYLSRRWKVVLWTLAALVCFARVYVGAHLPLDVIGGAAMGWGVGALVNAVLGEPHPSGKLFVRATPR